MCFIVQLNLFKYGKYSDIHLLICKVTINKSKSFTESKEKSRSQSEITMHYHQDSGNKKACGGKQLLVWSPARTEAKKIS